MVGQLLWRGMLAGVIAGLLTTCFGMLAAEPAVDRAIAFESAAAQAAGKPEEPEIVSRAVQRSAGLLTAAIVYGAGLGGLFALAFALANGRIGALEPRAVAATLAVAGFLAVALIPALKYPPKSARDRAAGDDRAAHRAIFQHVVFVGSGDDPRFDAQRRAGGKTRRLDRLVGQRLRLPGRGRRRGVHAAADQRGP